MIATGFDGPRRARAARPAAASRASAAASASASPRRRPRRAAPRRSPARQSTEPRPSERKGFEIPDDALEIPDFLKYRRAGRLTAGPRVVPSAPDGRPAGAHLPARPPRRHSGAKLVPFAGLGDAGPVLDGIARSTRRSAERARGLRRLPHGRDRGRAGPARAPASQRLLSNDVGDRPGGSGQYTLLLQDDGGVLDDLFTYRPGATASCWSPTPPTSRPATPAWPTGCRGRRHADRPLARDRDARRPGARAGPRCCARSAPAATRFALDYFAIGEDVVAGVPCLIARTGYTGEDGVELLCAPGRRARRSGTRWSRRAAPPPRASAPATRCASRSASTSTATTSRASARRSRPGSAGPATSRATGFIGAERAAPRRSPRAPPSAWRRSA